MTAETMPVPEREAFERWMIDVRKCVVGSSDPYPAGIERDAWQAWQAGSAYAAAQAAGGREDAARLDWVLAHSSFRVQGSDAKGWSVMDCRNGLTFLVRGEPTARVAIDAARTKAQGVPDATA